MLRCEVGGDSIPESPFHPVLERRRVMSYSASIEVAKAAITMEQVIKHYGLLHRFKQVGSYLIGPCPIHRGIDPTQFRIHICRNTWTCYGDCKHGGSAIDFVAIVENVSSQAAAMKAVEWFKLDTGTLSADGGAAQATPVNPRSVSEFGTATVSIFKDS